MERPARPLPPVLTATTDVGDLSATSATPHLVPDSAGITDGAGCVERRGHAAVLAVKPDGQLTGEPTAAHRPDHAGLLPGATTRALLAGAGDRPTRLEKRRRMRSLVPSASVAIQGLLSLGAGGVPADDLHGELAGQRPPVEVEPDEDVVEFHGVLRSRPGGALPP